MEVLITGTAGRVGKSIYNNLKEKYNVIGIDLKSGPFVDFKGDIRDSEFINKIIKNVDVVVHSAALHAPHVGLFSDNEFQTINVEATKSLFLEGAKHSLKHFVFTSTTALYGYASTPKNIAGWVDEFTIPQPKTIYHKTKIEAEIMLEKLCNQYNIPVTVLRMSRCFPEPADLMAIYRLNRGIDARDVAKAHQLSIEKRLSGFNKFIISSITPFKKSDCKDLFFKADKVLEKYVPNLVNEFKKRGWQLPKKIDRVYDSNKAKKQLSWIPNYGFENVLQMLDNKSSEVLPVNNKKINQMNNL